MFSIEHLNALRAAEIKKVIQYFPPLARVLEVGAGTGRQAMELAKRGYSVEAIEIPASNYAEARLFNITDFDGRQIPFPDASFDVVFSSNVLEHVPDLAQMHREIRRVLKPDGYAIHVLPTPSWRFWTIVSAFPTAVQHAFALKGQLLPRLSHPIAESRRLLSVWYQFANHLSRAFVRLRHGERGNAISEIWLFHPNWWRKNFQENGFTIVNHEPMGLFYTGNMTFGAKWDLAKRERLAKTLGSACHIFKLQAANPASAPIRTGR
jgi:SAM-dependent methyltransferase